MKLRKATLVLFSATALFATTNTAVVSVAESSTDSVQNVQKLPLIKKVHGVKRTGPWHKTRYGAYDGAVDTPMEIPYNDGTYNGYLQRERMYEEYSNGKVRWVVYYGGTVRLVSHGLITFQKKADR